MAEGNRKDPRARVLNMTVRYKSATVDEFIENHSHDISRGGIFIKTRAPFPAGTLLKFEVRIAEDQKLMQGVGRVVWRREPDRAEENFPAGMGIKFIKIGDGAAELISQIVAARQGAESSFDAGIRDTSDNIERDIEQEPSVSPLGTDPPVSAPALQVKSGSISSMPAEAEAKVSTPAKKRELPPEKRKVVVDPALQAASNTAAPPRPIEETRSNPASDTGSRTAIANETTSPGARARAKAAERSASPSVYGLVAILGVIGVVLLVINRGRNPPVAAEPGAPVTTLPAPIEPAAPPAPAPPPAPPAPTAENSPAAADTPPATAAGGSGATSAAGSAATPSATPPAPPSATPPAAPARPSPAAPAPTGSTPRPSAVPSDVPSPARPGVTPNAPSRPAAPAQGSTAAPAVPSEPAPNAAPSREGRRGNAEASRPPSDARSTGQGGTTAASGPAQGSAGGAAQAPPAAPPPTPPAATAPPVPAPTTPAAPGEAAPPAPPGDDNPY